MAAFNISNREAVAARTFFAAIRGYDRGCTEIIHREFFGAKVIYSPIEWRCSYGGERRTRIMLPCGTVVRALGSRPYRNAPEKLDRAMIWFCKGIDGCGNIVGWTDQMRADWLDAMEADEADEAEIMAFVNAFPPSPPNMSANEFRTIRMRMGIEIEALACRLREPLIRVKTWDAGLSAIPGSIAVLMGLFRDTIAVPAVALAA